jgi:hypothetical protein
MPWIKYGRHNPIHIFKISDNRKRKLGLIKFIPIIKIEKNIRSMVKDISYDINIGRIHKISHNIALNKVKELALQVWKQELNEEIENTKHMILSLTRTYDYIKKQLKIK